MALRRPVDRRSLRAVAVALLVVLAVGVAAATLTSTLQSGDSLDGGGGFGPPSDGSENSGNQNGGSDGGGMPDNLADQTAQLCFPIVNTTEFRLGLFAIWGLIGGALFWRLDSRLVAGGVLTGVTLQIGALYAVFAGLCGRDIREEVVRNATDLPSGTGAEFAREAQRAGGEAGAYISSNPIVTAIIVIVGLALLVGMALLYSEESLALGGASASTAEEEAYEEEYDARALRMMGEAAGEAADRIEAGDDADNEVYRAWREMTEYVDVDSPESSTPGEFADAAISAGMSRDDVAELTHLFEAVRYGGLEPTAEATERATTALRNIEASYAEAQSEDDG